MVGLESSLKLGGVAPATTETKIVLHLLLHVRVALQLVEAAGLSCGGVHDEGLLLGAELGLSGHSRDALAAHELCDLKRRSAGRGSCQFT